MEKLLTISSLVDATEALRILLSESDRQRQLARHSRRRGPSDPDSCQRCGAVPNPATPAPPRRWSRRRGSVDAARTAPARWPDSERSVGGGLIGHQPIASVWAGPWRRAPSRVRAAGSRAGELGKVRGQVPLSGLRPRISTRGLRRAVGSRARVSDER